MMDAVDMIVLGAFLGVMAFIFAAIVLSSIDSMVQEIMKLRQDIDQLTTKLEEVD